MNVFFLTDWALPPPTVSSALGLGVGVATPTPTHPSTSPTPTPNQASWAWRVLVLLGATPALGVICLAFVFKDDRGCSPPGKPNLDLNHDPDPNPDPDHRP